MLADTLQLEREWRVALAEIIFATSIKNITTKENFVYAPEIPFKNSPTRARQRNGECEDWSNKSTFPDGEYKTLKNVVTGLMSQLLEAQGSL